MRNKSPLPTKKTYQELIDTNDYFRSLLEINKERIQRFCANNQYLLDKRGESVYKQLRTIIRRTNGFKICDTVYSALKLGKRSWSSDIVFLVLADYHGLTVNELENLKRDDEVSSL